MAVRTSNQHGFACPWVRGTSQWDALGRVQSWAQVQRGTPGGAQPLEALWVLSRPFPDAGQRKDSSRDPEPEEGPWPLSGPWRLRRSLFDRREGFLPPREEHLSPSKVWDVFFWDTRQEEREWMICRHVCTVTELGKMILFCSEHYQVNCTSSISVGSIHMKLWNSWWLCLGNCSFLIGSSITHEFNSKQCYQQIQMIYILSSLPSLSHTLSDSKRWILWASMMRNDECL